MKPISLMYILVVLVGLPLSPALGQAQTVGDKQEMHAQYTKKAPVIDGQVSVDEWSAAVPVHVEFDTPEIDPGVLQPGWASPENQADLSFDIRVLYDDENLFFLVEVADGTVIHDGPGTCPCDDDDVELFFDGDRQVDPESQYGPGIEWGQFLTDTNGDKMCSACDFWGKVVEWESVPGPSSGGYLIETRIPLNSIDVLDGPDTAPPKPGDYIGFNVVVGDDDNGGAAYEAPSDSYGKWTGRLGAWNDSASYGLLRFEFPATAVESFTWGQIKEQAK
jgi:hypothetical protein